MSFVFATVEPKRTISPEFFRSHSPLSTATVYPLLNEHEKEVLDFLSRRPIHTVCMASYIQNHGVVSDLNRGVFFGSRARDGSLTGVALIGHATLIETESDHALKAFAQLMHDCSISRFVRGEEQMIRRFWHHYVKLGHTPRLARRELLFEQQTLPEIDGPIPDLRTAKLADLEQLVQINARLIFSECGVDPLKTDATGFRERLALRIQQERVFVWRKNGQLVFKADVFAETPAMMYIEGVNVSDEERGKGHGLRCLLQLNRILLERSQSICLAINERNEALASFYEKAGYQFRGMYQTIYPHVAE